MINSKLYVLLFAAMLLSGCNLVYKQSVQQGNAIEQDAIDDLNLGMSKRQVSLVMGTPAVHDPFHVDRWDYIYTFRPRGNDGSQRNITLYFEDDALTRIEDKGFRSTGDDSPVVVAETTPETDVAPEAAEPEVADTVVAEPAPVTPGGFEEPALASEPEEVVIDQVDEVIASEEEFEPESVPQQGFYSVQLGNFTDLENAEILRDLVQNAGHTAVIDELSQQSPVRYRVRSGELADRQSADALVESLDTDTGHYGFVIRVENSDD